MARHARTAALAAVVATLALHAERPVLAQGINCVTAPVGTICGTTDTATVGTTRRTIPAYKGIRYAQPPTGDSQRRWKPPVAILSTPGTTSATQYGSVCLQKTPPAGQTMSEDCLFLNVWTPTVSPATKMPVMVFIHGGAFVGGSGSSGLYNGTYLAASGSQVVVTLNYRLGPLGFLYGSDDGRSVGGNLGLLDQRTAMQWVRRNIGAFGGDSSRVTLFGESAGAMSVGLHLFSMPASDSLFQAAIMESNPMGYQYRSASLASTNGTAFINDLCVRAEVHCLPSRKNKNSNWMQLVDSTSIRQVNDVYMAGLWARLKRSGLPEGLPWAPMVDDTGVVAQPSAAYANTSMRRKPFVFGMNRDEGVIFAAMGESLLGKALDPAMYDSLLSRVFGRVNADTIQNHQAPDGTYPYRAKGHATRAGLDATAAAMAQLLTDFAFNCANLAAADSAYTLNGTQPIFGYRFMEPPFFNLYGNSTVCVPGNLYACHAYELPYVFRTLAFAAAANGGTGQPTDADKLVSAAMTSAWTGFAKTPTSPVSNWARYVRTTPPTADAPKLMAFGPNPGMQGGLAIASSCSMWKTMPPFQAPK